MKRMKRMKRTRMRMRMRMRMKRTVRTMRTMRRTMRRKVRRIMRTMIIVMMTTHLTMASAVRPPENSSGSVDPGAKYLMVGYPWTPYSWAVLACWVASREPSSILPFSLVAASAQGWARVLQWPHLEGGW